MNNDILEVKDINAAYDEAKVLFNISMNIERGKTSVIVGRNGAGKSTLFRVIAGFRKPTCGSVIFWDNGVSQNIVGLPPYKISNLGLRYIAQDKAVFSDLTVKENLELAAYPAKDTNWEPVFSYFPKLKTLLNRKGAYLSGGERQMLMIGRSFLSNPKLLLLDEPMEGLAPGIVQELIKALCKIKSQITLLIVEQNIPVICELADKVFAIKEGRIVNVIDNMNDIKNATFEKYL